MSIMNSLLKWKLSDKNRGPDEVGLRYLTLNFARGFIRKYVVDSKLIFFMQHKICDRF